MFGKVVRINETGEGEAVPVDSTIHETLGVVVPAAEVAEGMRLVFGTISLMASAGAAGSPEVTTADVIALYDNVIASFTNGLDLVVSGTEALAE